MEPDKFCVYTTNNNLSYWYIAVVDGDNQPKYLSRSTAETVMNSLREQIQTQYPEVSWQFEVRPAPVLN